MEPTASSAAPGERSTRTGTAGRRGRSRDRSAARLLRAAFGVPIAAWLLLLVVAAWRSRLDAPDPTLLIRDRQGRFLAEVAAPGPGSGYWLPEPLPDRLAAATLALEDRRFSEHPGVDLRAVARALWQNLRSGSVVSGASTVAMQVARMQQPGDRTYPRKLVEATTALFLTARHGRQRVLAHYLRIVPYSNNLHGAGYAARRYFDKPVEDLSWAETVLLAAIPQSPARMNPYTPRGRARAVARGLRILDQLASDQVIDATEEAVARRQLLGLRIPPRTERPEAALHVALRLEQMATDRAAKQESPIIGATLDLTLQQEVEELTRRHVERWLSRGAGNAAALVVDLSDDAVLAAVGSTGYFDERHAGAIDYTRVPRSSGSTLKPFLYGLALDAGVLSPTTILDDLDHFSGGIRNADGRFLGPLLPRAALANSRNVPAATLLRSIGLDRFHAFLGDAGLHRFGQTARRYGLGLAIGSLPVTLEQLVRAYTAFAGNGSLRELRWLVDTPRTARRLLSEEAARQVTLFLSDPQARLPSFPRMGWSEYPFATAVKTGTSSGYHDAWAVVWTRRFLVGVWVGHPRHRPMTQLSGYRSAAQLAQAIVLGLHPEQRDGLEAVGFPPPRGYRSERVCALSGRRATSACDRVAVEWIPPDLQLADCGWHRRTAVDRRNGLLASSSTPVGAIELRTFVDPPPRYAGWAAEEGLTPPPLSVSTLGAGATLLASTALPTALPAPAAPTQAMRVLVTTPLDGSALLLDPEAPPGRSTVALRAVASPAVEQILWVVDGQPWKLVDSPYTAYWPLQVGEHTFEARVPFSVVRSGRVQISVGSP